MIYVTASKRPSRENISGRFMRDKVMCAPLDPTTSSLSSASHPKQRNSPEMKRIKRLRSFQGQFPPSLTNSIPYRDRDHDGSVQFSAFFSIENKFACSPHRSPHPVLAPHLGQDTES
ncbi:hypothetical protein ONS96_006545 [Cadophora gregata f. sp. sojae]|nr:hypothetical protein ONS96_006545 [Cadophora gregata f. sp. sojae]